MLKVNFLLASFLISFSMVKAETVDSAQATTVERTEVNKSIFQLPPLDSLSFQQESPNYVSISHEEALQDQCEWCETLAHLDTILINMIGKKR